MDGPWIPLKSPGPITKHAYPKCAGLPVYDPDSGSTVCNICGAEEMTEQEATSNERSGRSVLLSTLGSSPHLTDKDFVGRNARSIVTVPQLLSESNDRNQRIQRLAEQVCRELRADARIPEVVSRTRAIVGEMERRGKKKVVLWKPLFYALIQTLKRSPTAGQFRTVREVAVVFDRLVPAFAALYGRDEKIVMNLLAEVQKYTEAEYIQADARTYILRYTLGLQNFGFVHDEIREMYGVRSKNSIIGELCDSTMKLTDSIQKRATPDADHISQVLQGLRPTTQAAICLLLSNYILGLRKRRVLEVRTICRAIDVIDGRETETGEGSYALVKEYLLAITSKIGRPRK